MKVRVINSGFQSFYCKVRTNDKGEIIIDASPHRFYRSYGYERVDNKDLKDFEVVE